MIISVDETGFFKKKENEQFGLVTLVSITDAEWKSFSDYINIHFPGAFEHAKGSNISFADRLEVIKYIGRHPEIKYTTFLYQIKNDEDSLVEKHKLNQAARLQEWIVNNLSSIAPTLLSELELLRNWISGLSESDYAKFSFITNTFIEWEQCFLFDYIYTHISRDSWEMHHVIDTQNKPEKFRKLVKYTIKLTANGFTPGFSVMTPQEWDITHPYLQKHSIGGNVSLQDGNKFFSDIKVGSEQINPVLFIPDLIGNTIFNSILHSDDIQWLKILAKLKPNRSIVMTKQGKKDYYYLISGFSGAMKTNSVNANLTKHFNKMLSY